MTGGLWLRFLSGPDIDSLGISNAEIVAAVEEAVRAHGDGRVVVEPRVHLVPDNGGAGHFNVLRGHLSAARRVERRQGGRRFRGQLCRRAA